MATEPNPRPYKVRYSSKNSVTGVTNQVKGFKNDKERTKWIKSQKDITVHRKFME